MTTFDPMTSSIRAEMDAFHSRRNSKPARTIDNAPAFLFEDSAEVKAIKIEGLLKAREELHTLMMERGVTTDRIAAMSRYNDQLTTLGWTPSL